jgi:serine/threonine-protein kinase RsbW
MVGHTAMVGRPIAILEPMSTTHCARADQGRETTNGRHLVSLEFLSVYEMLDVVQVVSDYVTQSVGLAEDAAYWVGVAIREAVVNAIKHGNRNDASKYVFVEFETMLSAAPELGIRVRDQGDGFDPDAAANPLAPENMLKSSGRGIFLMRTFMDDVRLQRAPEGGMEIRMVKRLHSRD